MGRHDFGAAKSPNNATHLLKIHFPKKKSNTIAQKMNKHETTLVKSHQFTNSKRGGSKSVVLVFCLHIPSINSVRVLWASLEKDMLMKFGVIIVMLVQLECFVGVDSSKIDTPTTNEDVPSKWLQSFKK